MNLANHAVSICKLSKPTITCSWTIKHVKKYPLLFGNFVLVNVLAVSLFWCISDLIQTNTCYPFSFSMLLIDHISYPFKLLGFFSSRWWVCTVLGLYYSGSRYLEKNWVLAERHSRETTFGKSGGGIIYYVLQEYFLALQSLCCFSETHHWQFGTMATENFASL